MEDKPVRLFIALYLDEHVNTKLVADLRKEDFEAIAANEVMGNEKWEDIDHLKYAAEHQMAVLTYDKKFVKAVEELSAAGGEHWGVVIAPQIDGDEYGKLLRWTLNMLDKNTADELRNVVTYLQRFQ